MLLHSFVFLTIHVRFFGKGYELLNGDTKLVLRSGVKNPVVPLRVYYTKVRDTSTPCLV